MTPLPGHTLMPNPAYSNLIQTQTTPVSPTSCEEPIDFVVNDSKYEQLNNNLKAFKTSYSRTTFCDNEND